MWPSNESTIPNLIDYHIKNNSCITGCRLIYPSKIEYQEIGNYEHFLGKTIDMAYSTIQHGGITFLNNFQLQCLTPLHLWRYYPKDTARACYNNVCDAVTGAMHIINTIDFFDIKGLNIGLGTSFQDIALCIQANQHNKFVHYVGSEAMIHAESLTHSKEQITKSKLYMSDNLIWRYFYGPVLYNTLGISKE
jgi:GT2 family glycosyltransferase